MREDVVRKLEILQLLYKTDLLYPFPYDDCRKLLADKGRDFEDLIPSLDAYFSDIAGLCSSGKRSLKWSYEEIDKHASILQKSFFQKYPVFAPLQIEIRDKDIPTLFSQFLIYDLMRLTLLDILPDIKKAKAANVKISSELSLAS